MIQQQKRMYLLGGGLLLVLLIILLAVSCSKGTSNDDNRNIISNAAQLYSEAVSGVNSESLSYQILQKKETVIGNEAFNESAELTVTYENIGTEQFRGSAQETVRIGNHTVAISEIFSGGVGYFTVAGSSFSGELTQEAFIARYAPAVPVDPVLYNSITGYELDDAYTVEFTSASALETWLWNESSQFISSDAAAYISKEGQLLKSTYNASYTQGDAFIRYTVTVELLQQPEPIQVPEDLTGYTQLTCLDGPRMLETACGHLLESVSVTSYYTDSIICQAFGDARNQSISLHTVNASTWSSLLKTEVSLSNSGTVGSTSVINKTELFKDGNYTISINGSASSESTEVNTETMRAYCQDILVGTIMLPEHISDAVLTESEDSYVVTFTANEAFSQHIRTEACTTLYQEPEILTDQSEGYKTDTAICYLTIDKATGLPTASGFHYVGIYTIDALPYQLEFSADQQYELLNDTASNTINTEAGA